MRKIITTSLVVASILIPLFVGLIANAAPELPIIVVDLAHGQGHNGVCAMMKTIPDAYWVVVVKDEATAENLPTCIKNQAYDIIVGDLTVVADLRANMLIIGQPIEAFSDAEKNAIVTWFKEAGEALWCATDSDYPAQGGNLELAMINCNDLLDYMMGSGIDVNLRADFVSVEDPELNAGRSYRVVALVRPGDAFNASLIGLGAELVLMHGPGAVAWVDKDGNWYKVGDPGTPENIVPIVVTTEAGVIVEHQPKKPGEPGNLGFAHSVGETGSFVLMAAQVLNIEGARKVVIVSGESPYYGYQSLVTSEYYGVELDGPRFFRNLVLWAIESYGELKALSKIVAIKPTPTIPMEEIMSKVEEHTKGVEQKMSSRLDNIDARVTAIENSIKEITSSMEELSNAVNSVSTGFKTLQNNMKTLADSMSKASEGLTTLKDKVSTLYTMSVAAIILAIIALVASGFAMRK